MLRSVIVIGGGLSGLAAAFELEQQGIDYTLIEVKPRLGGSIATEWRDGFALDAGPMLSDDAINAPFIEALGLRDEVYTVDVRGAPKLAFRRGTQTLIDALASRITAPRMMRMAVSSLGTFDHTRRTARRFSVCLENGILLDAQALIVAVPARYAERLFYTLTPEISARLLDYRYDPLARLSIGVRRDELPAAPLEVSDEYPINNIHLLDSRDAPERAPQDHVVIQAAVRYDPHKGLSPDIVGEFCALLGLPLNPQVEQVALWPESDPIMWLDEAQHTETMRDIRHLLPEGVALVGSDYVVATEHAPTLQDRITQGVEAAHKVLAWLRMA